MSEEIMTLKVKAEEGKAMYFTKIISRDEAREYIMPYINAFNARSKEIAKKYNQKPRLIDFAGFLR